MALTKAFPRMMEGVPISVKDFGAVGDGVTDDTAAFQAAFDAAKGTDGTGEGRSVFTLYIPNPEDGFYKITDTLVIDGTYGFTIKGDGASQKRGQELSVLRWFGSQSKPVIQVKGGTGIPSNPNFLITIRDLTINGYESSNLTPASSTPSNIALAGIYIGNLDNDVQSSLCRNCLIENVNIQNCRFGIWSGQPESQNTDHASFTITHCLIRNNRQAGVVWGTGNAIGFLTNSHVVLNGYAATDFAADAYMPQKGANVYLSAGSLFISNYTGAGDDTYTPNDADIYQESGQCSIINAWSDTEGPFFYQASVSQNANGRHAGLITGVRHYNGSASFEANTDISISIVGPGTTVTSCMVYGDIEVRSGLGGRPVFSGITFGNGPSGTGSGFRGTGIDTQRSLINIGNATNSAQILMGGTNSTGGETLTHNGNRPPQILSVGTGAVGTGVTNSLMQWKGATSASSSGTMAVGNFVDGSVEFLLNCYIESPNYIVENSAYPCARIILSTTGGVSIDLYDPNGGTTFSAADWVSSSKTLAPTTAGYREESCYRFPLRSANPTFSSGDFWEGSVYYNTTTNKLRVNVGGSTWQDLN